MLSGFSRLISEDIRNTLNTNPIFQWIVVALLVLVGVTTAINGINGIKNKHIRGRYGHMIEGTTAQILGVFYALLGIVMAGVAVSVQLSA